MKVPLLDVNAQNAPLDEELKAAFERVLHSGRFILGPEVEELERRIAEKAGTAHGIGVSSGTDAILLALMVLGIGPGDEVLCPSFTFFATAGCIARTGATPIFVDSVEDSFNIDVADAERKITGRTKAIVPVHLFGQAADMDGVMALAREHNLHVVEDGAQALGARYRGRPVGSIGDFGTFSFFPSKNLGGFGDGGMLVCNDADLAKKAQIFRGHGAEPKYFHKFIGGNFRLDPFQAALLLVKLPHYNDYTRRRQENAAYYSGAIDALNGNGNRNGNSILPPVNREGEGHIWNQFTVRLPGKRRRDHFREHLLKEGIASEIYYPVPMDAQECFAHLNQRGACPTAARLAEEVLSLPVFPELDQAQREAVMAAVHSFAETERPVVSA